MAHIPAKSQVLVQLGAIIAADLLLAAFLVSGALKAGVAPWDGGFSRERHPLFFWGVLALAVTAAAALAGALCYAVLAP